MRLVPAPPRCSGCFLQKTEERHVDFESAYDGPYVPGAPPVSIDDLVLCETCLTNGAREIGLGDVTAVEQELGQAQDALRGSEEARLATEQKLAAVQAALVALSAPDAPEVPVDPAPAPKPSAQPARHQRQQRRKHQG